MFFAICKKAIRKLFALETLSDYMSFEKIKHYLKYLLNHNWGNAY